MKTSNTRYIRWFVLAGASFFLGACINSAEDPVPGTGTDSDFLSTPVDARAAGQTLAGSFDQSKDWQTAIAAPIDLQPLGGFSTKVGALKKQSALPKRSDIDIGGGLHANLDDTAADKGGIAILYSESKLVLSTIKDTALVRWDDQARDTVKDNEHIVSWKRITTYIGGKKTETAEFTDGDGDGLITPEPGRDNQVRINLTVADNDVKEKTTLRVGAGPDDDFDLEADNTILEATWTKTKGKDVIGQGAYLDGDGDGIVTDNAKTCVVEAKYSEMYPKDRPLVKKVTFDAKIRVFPKATGGDEPVTFAYEEEMISGRVNSVSVRNRAGGLEFVRGDTMTVRLETLLTKEPDTLKMAVIEIVMNPGQDLNSDLDDSCYAIHITTEKRGVFERTATFNFVSDTPILHGQEPTAGTFGGSATYANGKTASLKGSFSPTGFTAEFTGPEGGKAKVEYSQGGDLLSGGNI